MQERERRARAGLAVAALAYAAALAGGSPPPADCPQPGELRARGGHSVVIACRSQPHAPALRGPARLLVGLAIDPNQADAATLEALPGIGPARAQAIVAARERRGFDRVGDLARVPGIGPRTLAGLEGWIGIAAPPGWRATRSLGPCRPDPVGCAAGAAAARAEGGP